MNWIEKEFFLELWCRYSYDVSINESELEFNVIRAMIGMSFFNLMSKRLKKIMN